MDYKTGDTIFSIEDDLNMLKFVVTDEGVSAEMWCFGDMASIKLDREKCDSLSKIFSNLTSPV